MSDAFKKYDDAKKFAQAKANETGRDFGLELNKLFKEYIVFGLPNACNRTGHELRCEVVHPDNIETTSKGHGYEETRKQPCGWHYGS